MNKKLLLSFTLAAAMTGCINDADVPSGNGDNPATGARGGNMEISFLVPNSSNGSRAASAEDSGVYEDGTAEDSFATAPKTIYNIVSELPKYKERLKSVIIENRDFEDLIKTYDRDSALFYVDPPYVASERYYNRNYTKFNKDDHIRLNAVLKGIKGRFILSYNDCDFIRDLYKGYNIKCVSRQNLLPATAENRAEFKEVIITNY